ncbi:hypothetical protein J7T55_012123 [Diaporthe amygdali]|uniref:uncharacterized protein n=1 Tax=Phomopsis amygdali TaxID=1214568 RepID=UPI0022FEECEE|nr:uncharacterized protein J7T55_012123 [Diaporthe amygdali]KAJ0123657.1 hypothetical protein J7T55_012123 [Diaporthe amygdali]
MKTPDIGKTAIERPTGPPDESILNRSCVYKTVTPVFEIQADTKDPAAETLTVVSIDYFSEGLYDQPLSHRAWALQERVMAARVVSFGLGELFWDCAQLPNTCESIPGGLQGTQVEAKDLSLFGLARKSMPDGSDDNALLEAWWSLLGEYTNRRLTYPKNDKLVALSAITLELAQSIPSWSWASMDGPIFAWMSSWKGMPGYYGNYQQLAEAVSYTLELASTDNPTGPCVSASLSIRAYCTEVQWKRENNPVIVARSEMWASRNIDFTFDFDEREILRLDGSKYLLAAITEQERLETWSGLVLESEFQAGEIRYRRIGHFVIEGAIRVAATGETEPAAG